MGESLEAPELGAPGAGGGTAEPAPPGAPAGPPRRIRSRRRHRARAARTAGPGLGAGRRLLREVGLAMVTAGVVILLFVVYQLYGTALTEQHDQSVLARSFARDLAASRAATTPSRGGTPATGGDGSTVATPAVGDLSPSTPAGVAVDHLVIPSIGVDKFVVQGTVEADLMEGPGHYVGTPMPGEKGNAAIAGHRTTYGAPFFELNQLKAGAWIYVTDTAGRTFDYRVHDQRAVSPDDDSVLDDTTRSELTLTTCNPPYSATSRLVVVAYLVGRPAPTPKPAPRPAASPHPASPARAGAPAPGENLGTGNSAGWPPAIAYGAAVVALWVLTRLLVARTRRWRRAGALTAGILVCAVPLWFCFENVVRLLPQNL